MAGSSVNSQWCTVTFLIETMCQAAKQPVNSEGKGPTRLLRSLLVGAHVRSIGPEPAV